MRAGTDKLSADNNLSDGIHADLRDRQWRYQRDVPIAVSLPDRRLSCQGQDEEGVPGKRVPAGSRRL